MSKAYSLEKVYESAKVSLVERYRGEKGTSTLQDVPQIIGVFQHGSRYIGMHTEKSDYDYTVMCMPSAEMMYRGDKVSFREKWVSDTGHLVELAYVDVRTFIDRLRKSIVSAIQLLYATADQCYFPSFTETNLLRVEEVQDYIKELMLMRDKLYLLSPRSFYDSTFGAMREQLKSAKKAFEAENWEKVIKHTHHVEYMTELLHGVYNSEPIHPLLRYSELVTQVIASARENATESTASVQLKIAEGNIEEFQGDNQYKEKLFSMLEQPTTKQFLSKTLRDIMLGGYAE